MSHLELHAQLKIRPGQLEAFTAQAAEIVRLAREKDTQTLRFDWFISEDGARCEVHETYESEAAFFEHTQHIMEARAKLFSDSVDGHHVTAYGTCRNGSATWRTSTRADSNATRSYKACSWNQQCDPSRVPAPQRRDVLARDRCNHSPGAMPAHSHG